MMVATPHILVVDDDHRLGGLLKKFFAEHGFLVSHVEDTLAAREALACFHYDAMVLDRMMPGEAGEVFAAALRAQGSLLPILMLTALGEPADRIAGLEQGVDDYLSKPFEPRELLLRLQGLLRRSKAAQVMEELYAFGPFHFSVSELGLWHGNTAVPLSPSEATTLHMLLTAGGETLSREALASATGVNERAVDVLIARLRKKVEIEGTRYIHTVRGAGYVWRLPAMGGGA